MLVINPTMFKEQFGLLNNTCFIIKIEKLLNFKNTTSRRI